MEWPQKGNPAVSKLSCESHCTAIQPSGIVNDVKFKNNFKSSETIILLQKQQLELIMISTSSFVETVVTVK